MIALPHNALPRLSRHLLAALLMALPTLLLITPDSTFAEGRRAQRKATKEAIAALPQQYREWLAEVVLIISDAERNLFLKLEEQYQRDAFIERFWKVRDSYPRTARNEYREDWYARIQEARENFGQLENDDRSRILLTNGFPLQRIPVNCRTELWPVEVWFYDGSDTVGFEFLLLFYQPHGHGPFRLWDPFLGLDDLSQNSGLTLSRIESVCGEDGRAILAAINFLRAQGGILGAQAVLSRIQKKPKPPNKEWIASFSTYSTKLPEGAETFAAQLRLDYPGRHMSRSVMQIGLAVPVEALATAELAGQKSFNLMLNGEVLRGEELFENFRYKFDLPTREVPGDEVSLVVQRYLRPGSYELILKVEDINSGRFHRLRQTIEVPRLDNIVAPPPPTDPETARLLAEANAAIKSGESTLELVPPRGGWQTGLLRVNTLTTGENIAKVTFFLDNRPILTKRRQPFSVELDLGAVPRPRELRIVGYDSQDEEIAADELTLNAGQHRFAVNLTEPRQGKTYQRSLRAQAEVILPEGEIAERVEFFLNETLVATVYQPPYLQPIVLPSSEEVAYVRAVAYTLDGTNVEDTVFINFPGYLEDVDVDFVELYTTVLDRDRRPVEDLELADFSILEDGQPQQVVRFEAVRDLPIFVATMLDVSASMDEQLIPARDAALGFFQQTLTAKDRGAVITFNSHPNLAAKFTNQVDDLAAGLAGLKAELGTALYDSLIFTLYYFNGISGQRAILLLSDGKDESSRYEFDAALEYAQRAGVSIYSIGLSLNRKDLDARRKLSKLAEATGGRSFFIDDAGELPAIYDAIQRELRSRYLLAYQSSNTSGSKAFRAIEVKMSGSGQRASTLRGYYP